MRWRLQVYARYYADKLAFRVAWWLPRGVVYWAFIRLATVDAGAHHHETVDAVLQRHEDWCLWTPIVKAKDEATRESHAPRDAADPQHETRGPGRVAAADDRRA